MEIKAEVKRVEALKDFFFVVPDYQREYVWESDIHVARFLQDINDEFDPKANEQTSYFIGSTIIVKRKDGQYDVIDGQQRLTTIIISLCAMREVISKLKFEAEEKEEMQETTDELFQIIKDLLYKYSIQHGRKTPRLVLQYEESKDYLLNLIEERTYDDIETNSIKRMKSAYSTILNFLKELEGNDDKKNLVNFIRYFLVNVEMVIIQPDDIGSALKIFETINERGVGLNAMDLLKNLLFSNADENNFKKIKEVWKEIIQNLERCGEADKPLRFLRYLLIARYHDGIIREEEIYKWLTSKEGKSKIKYETNPVKFAKEILKASEKYGTLIKATNVWEADPDYPSVTGIGYLSKKNSRQHIILLLALNDTFDKGAINLLAKNIEALMFYFVTLKVLTKYYEATFAEWAIKLRSLSNIDDLKKFIIDEIGPEIEKRKIAFDGSFENKTQGEIQPLYRIKYILGKVEEFIRSNVNFPQASLLFYQDQQLEHILPQTGENIPKDKYPEEYDYQNAVYKIGNLTLLEQPINGSLNNTNNISSEEWFNTKTEAYKSSNIFLTKTFTKTLIGNDTDYNKFIPTNLKNFTLWDRERINERQQMLKKLMLKTWSVDVK
jgi:uncharacterized protein with ParB-like and HNH nuclease domain